MSDILSSVAKPGIFSMLPYVPMILCGKKKIRQRNRSPNHRKFFCHGLTRIIRISENCAHFAKIRIARIAECFANHTKSLISNYDSIAFPLVQSPGMIGSSTQTFCFAV